MFTLAFLVMASTTPAYLPVVLPQDAPIEEKLEISLRSLADYYSLDFERLDKVIRCESNWKTDAFNPKDPEGGSVGIAQFQPSTFYKFATQLGIVDANLYNSYHQIEIMAYMWAQGEQNRWSCNRMD